VSYKKSCFCYEYDDLFIQLKNLHIRYIEGYKPNTSERGKINGRQNCRCRRVFWRWFFVDYNYNNNFVYILYTILPWWSLLLKRTENV